MNFGLDDLKKELENFHDSFSKFQPLIKGNASLEKSYTLTKSVDVFVLKFGYYSLDADIEIEDIKKHYTHQNDELEKYNNFLGFMEYCDAFNGAIHVIYEKLFRDGYYSFKQLRKNANFMALDEKDRQKLLCFRGPSDWLNEMADDVVADIIAHYSLIRKYKRVASIEKIMDVLRAGGLPCGFKYTDKKEDILDSEIDFLVYYPH